MVLMHWTKGSTLKKKKMKWKEQKGENHILVPGKDISSNMLCRHTAGQGTILCTPWKKAATHPPSHQKKITSDMLSRGLW